MALSPVIGGILRAGVRVDLGSDERVRLLEQLLATTTPEVLTRLPDAAMLHGVVGYTHTALTSASNPPGATMDVLYRLQERTALLHLRTAADLRYLADVLGGAGIDYLVVKGPTLAEPVHGSAKLRTYGDLDVLVHGRELRRALDLLERSGSEVTDRNWTLIAERLKGEVHLCMPSGGALDLHWHLLNDPGRRAAFPVHPGELLARRRTVRLAGTDVPTLAPADNIVYVALHLLHSGADRLIWLKDLERLAALEDHDPAAVAATARSWRAELVLRTALSRALAALGPTPGLQRLLTELGRRRLWDPLARSAWSRAPVELEDGTGSPSRIVAKSTRPTQGASFRELAHRSLLHLRGRQDTGADAPRRFDVSDPRSDRYDSGGPAHRDRYLTRVERVAT